MQCNAMQYNTMEQRNPMYCNAMERTTMQCNVFQCNSINAMERTSIQRVCHSTIAVIAWGIEQHADKRESKQGVALLSDTGQAINIGVFAAIWYDDRPTHTHTHTHTGLEFFQHIVPANV